MMDVNDRTRRRKVRGAARGRIRAFAGSKKARKGFV